MQTQTAPTQLLVFDFAVESLLNILQPLTPAQQAALKELGVDHKKLLPAYPLELYARLQDFVTSQKWPQLSREQAGFELGRAFIDGYFKTFMGKALKSVVHVIGPHRLLERMRRNFRSGNNYTESRLTQLGPTSYELWFNHVLRSDYYRGMVYSGLEMTGVKGIQVELIKLDGNREAVFHVSWKE